VFPAKNPPTPTQEARAAGVSVWEGPEKAPERERERDVSVCTTDPVVQALEAMPRGILLCGGGQR